jgi:hypothetical protein
MLSTEKCLADSLVQRPDDLWSGWSVVVARTVRVCVESFRVLSFLQDLLAKTAGLARETTCNGSRPPPFI